MNFYGIWLGDVPLETQFDANFGNNNIKVYMWEIIQDDLVVLLPKQRIIKAKKGRNWDEY